MKIVYEDHFSGKTKEDHMAHLGKFSGRCKNLKMNYANNNLIKVKLYSIH
jgi:hypothetical protein